MLRYSFHYRNVKLRPIPRTEARLQCCIIIQKNDNYNLTIGWVINLPMFYNKFNYMGSSESTALCKIGKAKLR